MLPCRRFADVLADACARLGADVGRYSFIAVDFHHILLAGLPAHSLTLRPARSADPLRGLSIEVLQIIRRLLIRSDRFRLEREFAGPDFHRGERCALPRHTEQSGREFASADATAGAQDATLQITRISPTLPVHSRRCPQHLQRPTPSHVGPNAPRASRCSDEHVADRGRSGLTIPKASTLRFVVRRTRIVTRR
jgi:hypothetical protein